MEERLTRGEGKVRGGRRTYSARHLIDLAGSACLSSMICVERKTGIPAVCERARAVSGLLHGDIAATRAHVPAFTAVAYRAASRIGRDPRMDGVRPSRIAEMSSSGHPLRTL